VNSMTESQKIPKLLWLNLLSLDAPLVAICWQMFFARLFLRPVDWVHPLLLGAAAWLAYSGDRNLDGFRASEEEELAPRHAFAIRHRKPLIAVWFLVLAAALGIGIGWLERSLFWRGLVFIAAVAVYFLLVFFFPFVMRRIVPREFAVSLLFVAGVACFLFHPSDAKSVEIWTALFWFGAICFINCVLISFWEREIDLQNEEVTAATSAPNLGRKANLLMGATLGVAALSWLASPFPTVRMSLIAIGISLVLLLLLNASRIDRELKPVLADLALLSPVLVYWSLP